MTLRAASTEDLAGFLLIDKPPGPTSHDVVARVRRTTGVRKAGHAGTLDPLASGLVVVGLGRATRLLRFLADLEKEYLAEVCFGVATDTLDADGREIERRAMSFEREDLEAVLPSFTGRISQVPPMVSALSVGGQRLHALARRGLEVERAARLVEVSELALERFTGGDFPTARLRVVCGKGTYVRVLADDLARKLGGRAHLTGLRRTRCGALVPALALEGLGEDWRSHLITPSLGLGHLPARTLAVGELEMVRTGRPLSTSLEGFQRVVDRDANLVAVYLGKEGLATAAVVLL